MNILLEEELAQSSTDTLFSPIELQAKEGARVPHHVAIIMDGNRRWAKQRHMPCVLGHWKGAEMITQIVKAAAELGVKVLTLYAFSTENWSRSREEIEELMNLFNFYLKRQKDFMIREGVRLETIGDIERLPEDLKKSLAETKNATAAGKKIDLVLALNYGGRDDIKRAVLSIVHDCEIRKIAKTDITESLISSYLDTAQWKDPDLFIRTSGEQRLSNFLLWQLSYTEVYVTKTLWPDFNEKHLLQAVVEFQNRERRLGGS